MWIVTWLRNFSFETKLGIFTGHDEKNKQSMFVCERSTFDDMIEGLMKKCQCGSVEWSMSRLDQVFIKCP